MAGRAGESGRPRSWLRVLLWVVLTPVALFAVALAAIIGINLVDEELKPETAALMAAPALGKVDEQNGYVDFLGMGAPPKADIAAWGREIAKAYAAQAEPGFRLTPQWEAQVKAHIQATREAAGWCTLQTEDCLALAKLGRDSRLANPQNDEVLRRYRIVREKPVFADVPGGSDMLSRLPDYSQLTNGAALARFDIAAKAAAGDIADAVAELEREVAFHRRMLEGGRTLITVMIAQAMLSRDLLLASELLRLGGEGVVPLRPRLASLVEFPVGTASVEAAMRNEASMGLAFTAGLPARLRTEQDVVRNLGLVPAVSGFPRSQVSLLMRENETLNRVAARYADVLSLARAPAQEFGEARKAFAARQSQPAQAAWYDDYVNPLGRQVADEIVADFGSYLARIHDLEALRRAVRLQAVMAEKGIVEPAEMAVFVAGEGAKAAPDPHTGKPFAFDPATKRLSFTPAGAGVLVAALKKRYGGRVSVQL